MNNSDPFLGDIDIDAFRHSGYEAAPLVVKVVMPDFKLNAAAMRRSLDRGWRHSLKVWAEENDLFLEREEAKRVYREGLLS